LTICELDHCFHILAFSTDAQVLDVNMRMQHEPVYGPEGHSLRWKIERAAEYVAYLEQDFPAKQRLHRAIDCNDIQQAWSGFKSWRFDAALETGMISSGTHHRHYYPKSSLRNASTLV